MPKSIQPSVVIGLGGTGVKTITYLKKTLEEQAADIRQFVRFLAIDIDEIKGEVPAGRLFGKPIRLDHERNEYYRIMDQTLGPEARNIPSVASWFPDEAYKYLPLKEGARQCKPVGRLGFFLDHSEIAKRVHRLTDRLVTGEIIKQFPRLRTGELNVYLVASICGGTGAGLLIDTAYELRYLKLQAELPPNTRIKGLFALGDVYDAISKRVLANTYASLREINWFQRDGVSFRPIYPDGSRDELRVRAFDSVYIVGSSNTNDIELSSPEDFAQLCAEMIFLDSGSDAQESGDSLSGMMQSARNNTEVYIMNSDADGTPRCYSSFGLCKVRYPAERVRDLCAARMAAELIRTRVIGDNDQYDVQDARAKAREFIVNEALTCEDDNTDLPDRFAERVLESGERMPTGSWITQSLAKAYNRDLENIGDLEIARVNQIVETLNGVLKETQESLQGRVISELRDLTGRVERSVEGLFKDNRGVAFVSRYLRDLADSVTGSRDFAQQELKNLIGHEKRLLDFMNNETREMAGLLEGGIFGFLKGDAKRAQLRETYKAIRQYFLNRVNTLKMRAAVDFYDGVYDVRQRLLEGGEGAITRLRAQANAMESIQSSCETLAKTFDTAYEDNKHIKGSPFEILVYDNEKFSNLAELYEVVATEARKTQVFQAMLERLGGSIWGMRDYLEEGQQPPGLRDIFLQVCVPPFAEEVDKKSVAQRIRDARNSLINPIDYRPQLHNAFELAAYYCNLNAGATRFADLRTSEQAMSVIVGYYREDDPAWEEVKTALREGMRSRGGQELPFSRSSDRHNILVYRELSGFPAYTLSRINGYRNSFMEESRREETPPLQMFTQEDLDHINVPTKPVLSRFHVLAVEALALGAIICDEEHYYLVTEDEWKRRRLAEEAQARGTDARIEDRTAGGNRKMGARLSEVVSRMGERLPDDQLITNTRKKYHEEVAHQIALRKAHIDRNIVTDLIEAIFYEGFRGSERERVDLHTDIQPAVVFLLKRDYGLREKDIFRPDSPHAELLRAVYIPHGVSG